MPRIRIASRLALIVVGGVVLVQILMAAAYFADRHRVAPGAPYPRLLERTAALVQVLDRVPVADRPLVLRAAAGADFLPRLREELPQEVVRTPVLRFAERRLRLMLGPDGRDRLIAVSLMADERHNARRAARVRDLLGARLHTVVGLSSGGYLEVESASNLVMRLFGIPAGLMAGVLSFAIAVMAFIAVRHETRPLSELTATVGRIGPTIEPQLIAERGAPDVRALIRAVNAMQTRIAELVRSRTLVLGAIGHDLRTYVTRLRLRLELLPESEQRGKAAADLDGMQALVDDALVFARASFGNGSGESADLAKIVRADVEARAAQGAAVTFAGGKDPLPVRGSPVALARVTANLVANALAYGGNADVSLHPSAEAVELRVEDRGPGIPAGERANVFEPFYRLEPSRNRDSGGAGLGLTIVRQIVQSLGGAVEIEDRPGGGTRVRVRLPRAETPDVTSPAAGGIA